MAASGYTSIILYNSGTTTNVPVNTNLSNGELAINYTDGKLFYKDNTGTVQVIATKATAAITLPLTTANGGTGTASTVSTIATWNNSAPSYTTTASAGTTTTLTASSTYYQKISGSTTQTFQLPVGTTLLNGVAYLFDNDSSGVVTINDSSSTLVATLNPGNFQYIYLEDNSTSAGSWGKYAFIPAATYVASGTTGALASLSTAQTWTAVQTFTNSDIKLLGSSTGATTFTSANSSATNYTITIPAVTDTLATLAGSETFTNKTLTNPTITAYLETAPTLTNSSTAVTLSLSSGTVLSYTLTGNCTFTMPTATSGTSFIVKLVQDGTGSRTATFTGVKWPAGTAPTITTTATTGLDILSFVCINSVWYGTFAQAFA